MMIEGIGFVVIQRSYNNYRGCLVLKLNTVFLHVIIACVVYIWFCYLSCDRSFFNHLGLQFNYFIIWDIFCYILMQAVKELWKEEIGVKQQENFLLVLGKKIQSNRTLRMIRF